MATQVIHHPPKGEFIMIGHGGAECPCKPRKTSDHKPERSRQGHIVTVNYWHNPLPEKES